MTANPVYAQSESPAVRELFEALRDFQHNRRTAKVDELRFRFGSIDGGPDRMRMKIIQRERDLPHVLSEVTLLNVFQEKLMEPMTVLGPLVVFEALKLGLDHLELRHVALQPPQVDARIILIHRNL